MLVAMPDFLNIGAKTPLRDYCVAAGAVCELSSNAAAFIEAARESFFPLDARPQRVAFRARIWADETAVSSAPWPKPYARGLDHIVFLGFEPASSMLIDLASRQVIGRFS